MVLGVAAAGSVAAAFGPVWVVRIGVLLALAAGLGVLWSARRRLAAESDAYAARSLRTAAVHASVRERQQRQHDEALARARDELQQASRSELAAARRESDRAQQTAHRLRIELAGVIEERSALSAEVARLSAAAEHRALAEPRTEPEGLADVHPLPRHGIVATADFVAGPGWDNLEVDSARG